ncbi:MAG: DNA primase [Candidatus Eremiobacter antarcticus]|nr:MAG: DNA primase [Candidatus Eremiobacter sp. RRmetagenome_bin22]
MTRYTADSRDRVRGAVDMVALVSARTELRRAGVNSYFGVCPFHEERTGSFHVRPEDKYYHCFGCQAYGDPFDFMMETEGLDFKGALEALADRFGVTLETEAEDPAAASRRLRRERLHSLLGRATAYYARYLWEAREAAGAREYLRGRGLSEQTLRTFRVGYAPSAWDRVLTASRGAGFTDEELLAAGLVQRSKARPGQVYDRFRERIMFPSADARGRVLGFGARAMRENQRPKYLNTSDGELYHKGSQLFGIDLARAPAARSGRMILVEGYTDVLALHQAGLLGAVGIMGTALTEDQVRELARVVSVLELCLDADRAGQDAMLRAARVTAGSKLELRVVPLPEGSDPAELVAREGADALRARVESSVPFAAFHVERILQRTDARSAEGRDRAVAELAPVLGAVPPSVLREDLLRRVAGRLELSDATLARLMASAGPSKVGRRGPGGGPQAAAVKEVPMIDQGVRKERDFLALCVALPEPGAAALVAIDPDELLTSGVFRRAARHIAGRTASPLADLPGDDEELARVVADLVARAGRAGDVSAERLEHARLILEQARLDRAIRRARGQGGMDIAALAHERERVREAILEVGARLERAV